MTRPLASPSRSIAALALLLAASFATAQQSVPPPPKPTDSGPSLEVTMKFIQEKMNEVGNVTFASYVHDNANGSDWANQISSDASNVVANPANCEITYHRKRVLNGQVSTDKDFMFRLRDVQSLSVMSQQQRQKQVDADGGHATWDSRIDPPTFVLVIQRTGNSVNDFAFKDEDMANRVAKAMLHAVELCGGGKKDEPF